MEQINIVDAESIETVLSILIGDPSDPVEAKQGLNAAIKRALIQKPDKRFKKLAIEEFETEYLDPNQLGKNTLMIFFDDCKNNEDRALTVNNGFVKVITGIRGKNTERKSMYIHACIEYLLRANRVPKYEFIVKGRNYYVPARPGSTEVKVAETELIVQQEVHLK